MESEQMLVMLHKCPWVCILYFLIDAQIAEVTQPLLSKSVRQLRQTGQQ